MVRSSAIENGTGTIVRFGTVWERYDDKFGGRTVPERNF